MRVTLDAPLGPLTTLRLGGRAARMVEVDRDDDVIAAIADADQRAEPVFVLGGGSNVVVADEGFAGLVVRMATRGVEASRDRDAALVDVAAGEPWEPFVARAVEEGWSGVESLSGIPGLVGATPIQNVGAYGQEVRETIVEVRAYDRGRRERVTFENAACRFAYRASAFKGDARFVVLGVRFRFPLTREGTVRYAELSRALGVREGERAPAARIRETVLSLRRGKGMVLDAADPDSVSAGSFFVNPILADAEVPRVEARARALGVLREGEAMPRFAADVFGHTKLSAAWLVERAGFAKGFGEGAIGVSRKHALALVHRGGGTTRELLALARTIREGVRARFGVELAPEPVMVGCSFG